MSGKIVIILAAFMFGMIASEDFTEINGDLTIVTTRNQDKQIPHKPIHLETLKLHKNVDGVMHYSLGARTSSTYEHFFK